MRTKPIESAVARAVVDGSEYPLANFEMKISNRIDRGDQVLVSTSEAYAGGPTRIETVVSVDPATYESLRKGMLYTVEVAKDYNPWHRAAASWRARTVKLRDGLVWEFRKRVLRRDLISKITLTILDCRLVEWLDE